MTVTVEWTATALLNLADILDCVREESPQGADMLAAEIGAKTGRIASNPKMYRVGRVRGTRGGRDGELSDGVPRGRRRGADPQRAAHASAVAAGRRQGVRRCRDLKRAARSAVVPHFGRCEAWGFTAPAAADPEAAKAKWNAATIADFPQALNESKSVDLGQGVRGTLTLIDYHGDVPIFALSVDGEVLFTGTAEQVIAQAAHYRKHRTGLSGRARAIRWSNIGRPRRLATGQIRFGFW